MAIIVLASAAGAPGVTTTALGLSLLWPRDVLLADCDRDPAQAIQAGFLQGADTARTGLAWAVQAHREGQPLTDVLLSLCVPLATDDAGQRLFLPGFTHPRAATLFEPAWPDLADALRHLHRAEMDVVVDGGRIGAAGLPQPLLAVADVVLVCLRSSLRSLAAVRLHLPGLVEACEQAGHAELGLAVVGPRRPYPTAEITAQFGLPALLDIDWDPVGAAVLSDNGRRPRRFDHTKFARSLETAAGGLSGRMSRVDALLRRSR